ncbi:hypothetical protein [Fimbriiglobus ruber]|uniref:hypothetical protein n=1 Tax=Fimbriiglobus ruber TaxID=1908690 RepID=UPI001EE7800A|nr:hypothetical protein [Fimbriiglobus ruber]
MKESEWLSCADVFDLWDSSPLGNSATDRQYRLFAAACCRRIWQWMPDDRARRAVETLERFADGLCGAEERQVTLDALVGEDEDDAVQDGPHTRAMTAAILCAGDNGCDSLRLADEVAESCAGAAAVASGIFDRSIFVAEQKHQCDLTRDMFCNPFRPVQFLPDWRTSSVSAIASRIYDSREFAVMPILADALEDAGCDNIDLLAHCRGTGPHVRGCWAIDLILDK